jgi:hypothetical protein
LICGEASPTFSDFGVLSNKKAISDGIEYCSSLTLAAQKSMYVSALKNIMKYTNEELTVHMENQTKEFQDWSDDVAVFFTARLVLFGKAIPISEKNAAAEQHIASFSSAGAAAEDASIHVVDHEAVADKDDGTDMKPEVLAHIKKNIAKGGVCVMCSKPLPDDNIKLVVKIKSTKEILNIVMCVPCSTK